MNPRGRGSGRGINRHALIHGKRGDPVESPQGVAAGRRINRRALMRAGANRWCLRGGQLFQQLRGLGRSVVAGKVLLDLRRLLAV